MLLVRKRIKLLKFLFLIIDYPLRYTFRYGLLSGSFQVVYFFIIAVMLFMICPKLRKIRKHSSLPIKFKNPISINLVINPTASYLSQRTCHFQFHYIPENTRRRLNPDGLDIFNSKSKLYFLECHFWGSSLNIICNQL